MLPEKAFLLSCLKRTLALVGALLLVYGSYAQPAAPARLQKEKLRFWNPAKMIETGVYYYPEAWPKDQWQRDLTNMAKMGFEFTHIGEFAWAYMEPEEGRYTLGWIDTVLNLAQAQGLKVILCTPSPAPPAWLSTNYPDILMQNADGITMRHQGRTHGSWSSTRFKNHTQRIVEQLAKRFGNHPAVWGWQIDNEPSHYGRYDYSASAQEAFRTWCQRKYGTLAKLNAAWGTSFWSNQYSAWQQIRIPNNLESTAGSNPHQLLDYKRFYADECAAFVRLQHQELRKYISPKQWITTNFMHQHPQVDAWRNADLDLVTYTMYPVAGGPSTPDNSESVRMGSVAGISFANDLFRSINGVTGVMELQPGQVNWASYNTQPYPGAVRMWLWNSFAGGLKLACSYRYRQPRFGNELYHYGMVNTDGVTPSPGGLEYSQFIREVQELRKLRNPMATAPNYYTARSTAILYSPDALWQQEIQPQNRSWTPLFNQWRVWHMLAKQLGCPVDFVDTSTSWSQYPYLIVPALTTLHPSTVAKLEDYAKAGGHLLITCRTGTHDMNGQIWQAPWASPILKLIGAKAIPIFDQIPKEYTAGKIKWGNDTTTYRWHTWADVVEPDAGTTSLASYQDQFYAGKAAITHKKLGKGSATYLGTQADGNELAERTFKWLLESTGRTTWALPNTLQLEWREGFWVACNYGLKPANLPMDTKKAYFIVGSATVPPAGVAVWTDDATNKTAP